MSLEAAIVALTEQVRINNELLSGSDDISQHTESKQEVPKSRTNKKTSSKKPTSKKEPAKKNSPSGESSMSLAEFKKKLIAICKTEHSDDPPGTFKAIIVAAGYPEGKSDVVKPEDYEKILQSARTFGAEEEAEDDFD